MSTTFRKVADLSPGDRLVMHFRKDGQNIVRTFDHMTGPHYKGMYGHDVFYVHYREGKTPDSGRVRTPTCSPMRLRW